MVWSEARPSEPQKPDCAAKRQKPDPRLIHLRGDEKEYCSPSKTDRLHKLPNRADPHPVLDKLIC